MNRKEIAIEIKAQVKQAVAGFNSAITNAQLALVRYSNRFNKIDKILKSLKARPKAKNYDAKITILQASVQVLKYQISQLKKHHKAEVKRVKEVVTKKVEKQVRKEVRREVRRLPKGFFKNLWR
ncbi:MAG: hypothetical protein IH948_04145 [Bacteroidetes bacterium]|nr:hypothetical protein [Bacteroidota bacterium]